MNSQPLPHPALLASVANICHELVECRYPIGRELLMLELSLRRLGVSPCEADPVLVARTCRLFGMFNLSFSPKVGHVNLRAGSSGAQFLALPTPSALMLAIVAAYPDASVQVVVAREGQSIVSSDDLLELAGTAVSESVAGAAASIRRGHGPASIGVVGAHEVGPISALSGMPLDEAARYGALRRAIKLLPWSTTRRLTHWLQRLAFMADDSVAASRLVATQS